eukprot:CAMPEP_0183348836 /NCGR_PEP_ID=MMETSP0164_2-20130417/13221_1 /TAXON_ID=221442 /ORGANISM="Coccolithus pelagicus ssp braarudi, Strain PLY182g" /LENGTH=104 /DNA_ID=CAMNT_0025520483 /DNA_START=243 /DNA_END=557 /DNA_ORIENTATION=-
MTTDVQDSAIEASHCSRVDGATHTATSQPATAAAAARKLTAPEPSACTAPALHPTTPTLPGSARTSFRTKAAFASFTSLSDLAEPSPRAFAYGSGGKSTSTARS